jgi:hypothetical protein
MGSTTVVVNVTGSHHNQNNGRDINKMAAAFVDELKAAGHRVESASITHGGREDLLSENSPTRSGAYDGRWK